MMARIAFLLLLVLLGGASDAHAYIDFGVGSFAFQLLIAWFLAAAFAIRSFWSQIVSFLKKMLGR
jgi:hypothetical protein